jgi:hypothetical protein
LSQASVEMMKVIERQRKEITFKTTCFLCFLSQKDSFQLFRLIKLHVNIQICKCVPVHIHTYHQIHNNSVLDNHVYIDTWVDYPVGQYIHLHCNKQNLRMNRFVDHMLNLRILDDIRIYMMHLHWYKYHNCMTLGHMRL